MATTYAVHRGSVPEIGMKISIERLLRLYATLGSAGTFPSVWEERYISAICLLDLSFLCSYLHLPEGLAYPLDFSP